MKNLFLLLTWLLLLTVIGACVPAFADDTSTAPAAATLQMLPAHTPAVTTATPAVTTMPSLSALPALPASRDVGSIIMWIFGALAVVVPWFGWFIDTLMPFLPCKANGILHGIALMFKAPTVDPATNTLTVQLDEIKAAIAELKGGGPTGGA